VCFNLLDTAKKYANLILQQSLRVERLKAFSLLRFFFALEKEMTRRHAQWLIVIKMLANLSKPQTPKTPTRQ
jgi:hypothetical protein